MSSVISQNRRSTDRPSGFTLVELLVVIGIIAVLISLLLPALGRVRKSAQGVACIARMRELGNASIMYANANSGRLPPIFREIWSPWITRPAIFPTSVNEEIFLKPYLGKADTSKRYICPGVLDQAPNNPDNFFSYRYNMYLGGMRGGALQMGICKPYRLTELNQTSRYVLFVDDDKVRSGLGTNGNNVWFRSVATGYHRIDGASLMMHTSSLTGATNSSGVTYTIKQGRVNMVFADGHVAGVPVRSDQPGPQEDYYVRPEWPFPKW